MFHCYNIDNIASKKKIIITGWSRSNISIYTIVFDVKTSIFLLNNVGTFLIMQYYVCPIATCTYVSACEQLAVYWESRSTSGWKLSPDSSLGLRTDKIVTGGSENTVGVERCVHTISYTFTTM